MPGTRALLHRTGCDAIALKNTAKKNCKGYCLFSFALCIYSNPD